MRCVSHVTLHTHVTRHTSNATRSTSHVTRHTSQVTRHTSHVTRHTSHFTLHTSHVTSFIVNCAGSHSGHIARMAQDESFLIKSRLGEQPRLSHVTRYTSHVTRHTSHITRHTSHVTQVNTSYSSGHQVYVPLHHAPSSPAPTPSWTRLQQRCSR